MTKEASLPNDAYGQTVSMTTDGVKDYYLVGGARTYAFPTGTPQGPAYLSVAIQENFLIFSAARLDYILVKYSRDTQIQLLVMYEAAVNGGLTNRAAYIAQLFTWVNGIVTYAGAYVAAVQALTKPDEIVASVWDPTQFDADPAITMLAAIQISD